MDLSNLKSSLFGYNKLAVSNYVSGLEDSNNQKIQEMEKASREAEGALRGQLDDLRAKYDEDVKKLNDKIDELMKEKDLEERRLNDKFDELLKESGQEEKRLNDKIDELTKERDLLRRDNDTIAATLLDAQAYAEELKNKADQRDKERDEEHLQTLADQRGKVSEINTKLKTVLGDISELLQTATNDLNEKAEILEETDQDIVQESEKYELTPEAEEAVEEETQEA